MKLVLFTGIPQFVSDIFAQVYPEGEVLHGGLELVQDQDSAGDGCFVVLQYNSDPSATYAAVEKIKTEAQQSLVLVFGIEETAITIRLMRSGVDLCFTDRIAPEQLKEYFFKARFNEELNISRNMHKYRWLAGNSAAIRQLKSDIKEAAHSNRHVVICGPAGTGKSNIAMILHDSGPRQDLQFKKVDLSTYEREYLDNQFWSTFSTLFIETETDIEGLMEPLYGTLYIDHLEEQSPDFIVSFLKMVRAQHSQTRIIIPWRRSRNIFDSVEISKDNYYLLKIPGLSERVEDIPMLLYSLLGKYAEKHNKKINNISFEALNVLAGYGWPGNIREMQAILETAVLTADEGLVSLKDIGINLNMITSVTTINNPGSYIPLSKTLASFQMLLINTVLELMDYDIDRAALFLRIDRARMLEKIADINSFCLKKSV